MTDDDDDDERPSLPAFLMGCIPGLDRRVEAIKEKIGHKEFTELARREREERLFCVHNALRDAAKSEGECIHSLTTLMNVMKTISDQKDSMRPEMQMVLLEFIIDDTTAILRGAREMTIRLLAATKELDEEEARARPQPPPEP